MDRRDIVKFGARCVIYARCAV